MRTWVWICPCEWSNPRESKEVFGSSGSGVLSNCKLPTMGTESQTWVLCKSSVCCQPAPSPRFLNTVVADLWGRMNLCWCEEAVWCTVGWTLVCIHSSSPNEIGSSFRSSLLTRALRSGHFSCPAYSQIQRSRTSLQPPHIQILNNLVKIPILTQQT